MDHDSLIFFQLNRFVIIEGKKLIDPYGKILMIMLFVSSFKGQTKTVFHFVNNTS